MKNTLLSEQEEEEFKNLHQEKMIQELLKGKESATQLRILLQKPPVEQINYGSGSSAADELAVKIVDSFTETLSMVNENMNLDSFDANEPSPKVCDENRKKRLGPTQRRGCYRRRNVNESRIQVSETKEDGYAWRKYGQKDILYSESPRCYYRCSHKYDQGCKATKQIQKIPQDSLLYQITYFCHHTCNNTTSKSPKIITEIDTIDSCLHNFKSKPETKPDSTFSCTTLINPTTFSKETHSDGACGDKSSVLTWQDMITPGSLGNTKMMNIYTSEFGSTNCLEEVVSSFATQEAFGVMDLVHFNNLKNGIYFDENDFF